MASTISQPDARPLTRSLIDRLLDALAHETRGESAVRIVHRDQHSNDVTEIGFTDGRTLMVKRGRYEWARERFATARAASARMRRAGIRVPEPLELPAGLDDRPLDVYWRIDHPTLDELWETLSSEQRRGALRDWGGLIARVHTTPGRGAGPLTPQHEQQPLERFLTSDVGGRLLPAVYGVWPAGARTTEGLLEAVPAIAARAGANCLLHNDPHMGNVLCEVNGGSVRCVGLLDLESALSGPPEADIAMIEVQHGPLFGQPLPEGWTAELHAGYGHGLDPWVLRFFRVYHLLNMGFYSAFVGHGEHAGELASAAALELDGLAASVHPIEA